jgi:hypothetical protein
MSGHFTVRNKLHTVLLYFSIAYFESLLMTVFHMFLFCLETVVRQPTACVGGWWMGFVNTIHKPAGSDNLYLSDEITVEWKYTEMKFSCFPQYGLIFWDILHWRTNTACLYVCTMHCMCVPCSLYMYHALYVCTMHCMCVPCSLYMYHAVYICTMQFIYVPCTVCVYHAVYICTMHCMCVPCTLCVYHALWWMV